MGYALPWWAYPSPPATFVSMRVDRNVTGAPVRTPADSLFNSGAILHHPLASRRGGRLHLSSDTQIYEIRRHPFLRGTTLGRSGRADRKSLRAPGSAEGLRDDQ